MGPGDRRRRESSDATAARRWQRPADLEPAARRPIRRAKVLPPQHAGQRRQEPGGLRKSVTENEASANENKRVVERVIPLGKENKPLRPLIAFIISRATARVRSSWNITIH